MVVSYQLNAFTDGLLCHMADCEGVTPSQIIEDLVDEKQFKQKYPNDSEGTESEDVFRKRVTKMRRTNAKITRYADGDFFVDIVDTATMFDAWLSHQSYGVSEYMFGAPKNGNGYEMTHTEFLEMVQNNLPEYEAYYTENVF